MHVSLTLFSGFSRTRLSISVSRMWLTYCISHTLFCSRASDPSCYYCILITLYYNENLFNYFEVADDYYKFSAQSREKNGIARSDYYA